MNNASKYTILDLPTRIKVARNQAVFGNYQEALKQYKLCLTLIQERISEISEPFLKEKWKVVEAELKVEIIHCNYLLELCNSFKTTPFEKTRGSIEERPVMRSDLITDLPVSNKHRSERQPFAHVENNKQHQSENIVNLISGGQGKPPVLNQGLKNQHVGPQKQQASSLIQPIDRELKPKNMLILNNKETNQIKAIFEENSTNESSDLTMMIGQMKNDNSRFSNDNQIQQKPVSKPSDIDDTFSMLINSFDKKGNHNIDFSTEDNYVVQRQNKGSIPRQEKKVDPMIWKPVDKPINENRGVSKNAQPTKSQPAKP